MKRLTTIRARSGNKPFRYRPWPRASVLAGASIAIMILMGRAGSGAAQDTREGDAKTPYAQVQNLGRVRVIVR
jgi:hypothetical protein